MKLYSFLGAVRKGYHPLSPTTGDNHIFIKPDELNYAYLSEKNHQETDSFSYIFTESSIFLSKICNWMIFFSNFA